MNIRSDVMKLTVPIITEQVFTMLLGVVNTIMASRIGKEAVSAIGMVDAVNNIFIAFFSSVAVGGTVVIAHYAGQDNIKDTNEAAKQSLFSGVALALAVTAVIAIFRNPLLHFLYGSADAKVLGNSSIYFVITLLTYPLIATTAIANGILRGAGDTKTPMKVTIFMNVINIVLSYVLIYGIDFHILMIPVHIPGFQVMGAALGIAIARTVGAVIIMLILFRGSKTIKLDSVLKFKADWNMQKSIYGIGIPASMESLMFNGGKLITQIFIVGMGTAALASNQIAGSVFSMINIPGSALSIAATTLVGQYMGKGESSLAKDTLIYLTKFSSLCLLVLCIFAFPFSSSLARIYSSEPEIVDLTASLIRFTAITTPLLWSLSFVLPSGLRGAGDAKYTMVTAIIGMWAFRILLGYLFSIPLKMGVLGIWMGMYVDWVVRGTLYAFRLKGDKWKQKTVIKSASSILSSKTAAR